jgi:hypothetical protein
MIGYIYKLTSPSGKVYIGQTKNIKNRFNQYKNKHTETQPKLHNSLCKYGFDLHKKEIIEEVLLSELSDREIHWINFYDSFKNGLNCTIGGDSGFMFGENNVSKNPEIREKMSLSKFEYYKTNDAPMKGKKHTDITKELIKEKRAKQEPIIRCYVLDLETGIYHYGIKELSLLNNIPYKTFFRHIKYTNKYTNKYIIC